MAHATGNKNYIWNRHVLSTTGLLEQGARIVQRSGIPKDMIDAAKVAELEGSYAEMVRLSVERWGGLGELTYSMVHSRGSEGDDNERRAWEEDPQWLYLPHLRDEWRQAQERGRSGTEEGLSGHDAARVQGGGHWLKVTGSIVWCTKCACFAHKRHGVGLKGACVPGRRGAARARLNRLHEGKHPISGDKIR